MLAHIPRQLPELGVFFDEALHVGDRFDVCVVLGFGLVLLHVFLDVAAQITKIEIHVFLEKWVLVLRENNLFQFRADIRYAA